MFEDRLIDECRDDYAQVGARPGELFLELGRLDNPGRQDYRLSGNALRLGYDRADVKGDPELDLGRRRRLAVVVSQRGGESGQKGIND